MVVAVRLDTVIEVVVKLLESVRVFACILLVVRLPAEFPITADPSKNDVTEGADIVERTSNVVVNDVPAAVKLLVLKNGV